MWPKRVEELSTIVSVVHSEAVVNSGSHNQTEEKPNLEKLSLYDKAQVILHYSHLLVLGLLSWGLLWFLCGDDWAWNGPWFRMVAVPCIAWATSVCLQSFAPIPPQLPALIIGILAGNLDYLDMREHPQIDIIFRKFAPVFILGKSSLLWNFDYMRSNWVQVASMGTLPWAAEVATVALFTHFVIGLPWMWGFSFGTFYACIAIPVVIPALMDMKNGPQKKGLMQYLVNIGGIDVTLSVVTYGMLVSAMVTDISDAYRYARLVLSPVVGIALGAAWGTLAGFLPHPRDCYLAELRILFVLLGGLFGNFLTLYFDWGGTALMAVLVCNAVAVKYWVKQGWSLMDNPATTAYRVLWSAWEPALFIYTGTFFKLNRISSDVVIYGGLLLLVCMIVRLAVAFITCRNKTLKEKLFICCCWSSKGIVQAVICPIRVTTLILSGGTAQERRYADDVLTLTVVALLVAIPLSFYAAKIMVYFIGKEKENVKNAGP